jgi:hypothetical protein
MNAPTRPMTFGEKACGVAFNPSNDDAVSIIKAKFADIVDTLNDYRDGTSNKEVARMLSIAITDSQTAQMWAVKAVTWKHN